MKSSGVCKQLTLQLEGVSAVEEFHMFPMGDVAIIPETFGDTKVSSKAFTVTFDQQAQHVQLRGDISLDGTLVSSKSLLKELEVIFQGVLLVLSRDFHGVELLPEKK